MRIKSGVLIAIVFVLNYFHVIQQGTFRDVLLPMAENLLSGARLTNYFFPDGGATYPLWGYVFLLIPDAAIGSYGIIILVLQAIMCYFGIILIYRMFSLQFKNFHLFFLLPFIALMSTRMPDAPVCFLLILYAYFSFEYFKSYRIIHLVCSGLALGLISNFRSEYLYLPIFQMLFIFFPIFRKNALKYSIYNISVLGIMVIMMVPWALRMKSITGKYSITATNGGAVAYLSLGQLPNNSWNITPTDSSAFAYAFSKGNENAYSYESDKLLKAEFYKLVRSNSDEYAKKCLYNGFRAVTGGVYTGEYANNTIDFDRRYAINSNLTSQSGLIEKILAIFKFPIYEMAPLFFEKVLQGFFIPIFFVISLVVISSVFNRKYQQNKIFTALIFILLLYKLITVSALQYEYRHLNSVYILLFGIFLSNIRFFAIFRGVVNKYL